MPNRFSHRRRLRRFRSGGIISAIGAAVMLAASSGQAEDAHFTVSRRVINADLPAISATIEAFGNGARFVRGGGFEYSEYRDRIIAAEDAPSRVIAPDWAISGWDSLPEGALDGAAVRVFRIENGAMRLVAEDRVAEGGHAASGWVKLGGRRHVLPPAARESVLAWEPFYRPGARTWFTLRAVGEDGSLSAPAGAVLLTSPEGPRRNAARKADAFGRMTKPQSTFRVQLADAPAGAASGPDAPLPPEDLTVATGPDGLPVLRWRAATGGAEAAGWALYRSQTDPALHRGYALELEGETQVRAGDMIFLGKQVRDMTRAGFETDRIWDAGGVEGRRPGPISSWRDDDPTLSWRLRPHAADTPVSEPGRTYLEVSVGRGGKLRLDGGGFAGTDQNWYEVFEPGQSYVAEAWVRGSRTARGFFRLDGPNFYAKSMRPMSFRVTPEWQLVRGRFTPARLLEEGQGGVGFYIEGPGRFDIDNFRIYREDAPYMAMPSRDAERLRNAGVEVLRYHSTVRTKSATYDLEGLTDPPGLGSSTLANGSLAQVLDVSARTGIAPWVQIEPHLDDAEWLGLLEYLAAPAGGSPWADKRADQGQDAPWTETFDKIYVELGNETWNGIFAPWAFQGMTDAVTGKVYDAGEVYGLFQQRVIDLLKSSPLWAQAGLEDKIVFVLGGWNINAYGERAAAHSPDSDMVGVAPYIGGWDVGESLPTGAPEDYFALLNWVSQAGIPEARMHMHEAEKLGRSVEIGTYEGGPGYVLNVAGRRLTPEETLQQERVMKSQAVGVAALDNYLALANAGYRLQNFFSFGAGDLWRTHAHWWDGGQDHPAWKLVGLYNREWRGDMLAVETRAAPTVDLPEIRRRKAMDDAPLVAAYAARREGRVNLFLVSRRIPGVETPEEDGCTPVSVDLPFARAGKVTLHRMTGPYDGNNLNRDAVRVETLELPPLDGPLVLGAKGDAQTEAATGAAACGLPPASAFLYVFEDLR